MLQPSGADPMLVTGYLRERLDWVREVLRRAILTLGALPDPDLRYRLGPHSGWPAYVQETRDAYASAPPKLRTFQPTQQDVSRFLDVLGWLSWYGREHSEETRRLFVAWVLGAPMWMLQQRCSTNRRQPAAPNTVRARLDELVLSIMDEFRGALDKLLELPQISLSETSLADFGQSDLRDLPTSPRHWMAADGKPAPLDSAEAAAARKADKKAARTRERLRRRYGRVGQ